MELVLESKFEQFSYLSSKWVVNQWKRLATSTMHLAQELLTKVQCSGGSRSFAKETSTLKMRSAVADYQKLIRPTERIIKADPLTTTQEVSQELSINHSVIIWHLKQIRNVQKL